MHIAFLCTAFHRKKCEKSVGQKSKFIIPSLFPLVSAVWLEKDLLVTVPFLILYTYSFDFCIIFGRVSRLSCRRRRRLIIIIVVVFLVVAKPGEKRTLDFFDRFWISWISMLSFLSFFGYQERKTKTIKGRNRFRWLRVRKRIDPYLHLIFFSNLYAVLQACFYTHPGGPWHALLLPGTHLVSFMCPVGTQSIFSPHIIFSRVHATL